MRSLEHVKAFEPKKSNSVLYKHKILDHSEEEVKFELEVTGIFKDALSRQANESVRIFNRDSSEILNSKSEFCHPPTARIVVEGKKKKYKANQPGSAPACFEDDNTFISVVNGCLTEDQMAQTPESTAVTRTN